MAEIKPYNTDKAKKEEVKEMFDNISPQYDFLNRLLSARIDVTWRNKVVDLVKAEKPAHVLDVATGTGDLAIAIAKKNRDTHITGFDLSGGMLAEGRKKIKEKNLTQQIEMVQGDAENMPFEDQSFEVITAAFGVRNFENLKKGLKEFNRVLKPGGKIIILEFSQPSAFPMKQLYHFYSFKILPAIGKLFSKDPRAYTYLPESVKAFPHGKDFVHIIEECGFTKGNAKALTFGIASIYQATK